MPFSLMRAVEETVAETLRQGIHGWQVTDCVVTMTHPLHRKEYLLRTARRQAPGRDGR